MSVDDPHELVPNLVTVQLDGDCRSETTGDDDGATAPPGRCALRVNPSQLTIEKASAGKSWRRAVGRQAEKAFDRRCAQDFGVRREPLDPSRPRKPCHVLRLKDSLEHDPDSTPGKMSEGRRVGSHRLPWTLAHRFLNRQSRPGHVLCEFNAVQRRRQRKRC